MLSKINILILQCKTNNFNWSLNQFQLLVFTILTKTECERKVYEAFKLRYLIFDCSDFRIRFAYMTRTNI